MATCNDNCACGRPCLRQEQQSGRCNHDCRRDDCPVLRPPKTFLGKVETAENLARPILKVRHADLKRVNDTSPFRSWCPVCDQGILLVSRVGGGLTSLDLSKLDHCTLCGQQFLYEEDEIGGSKLITPPNLSSALKTKPKTRFDRIDDE